MATIRKVADLAGVSTATVSHVINDTRAVSATLTARVLYAMEQLDYQPDIIARSLRRRETLTGSRVGERRSRTGCNDGRERVPLASAPPQ